MAAQKKKELALRSSAAEYLTFVAATGESDVSFEMRYEDENIWLTQKMMAALYDVGLPTINEHIKKIYADRELTEAATIRKFRIVQTEGVRQVNREVAHFNLQIIIAVGFKVNNQRAVQFRKWAGQIVKDHTIQGWTMDVERLKKGHMFTDEYFERQLEQIREIRLSERKFYQKVTDLYATVSLRSGRLRQTIRTPERPACSSRRCRTRCILLSTGTRLRSSSWSVRTPTRSIWG